MYLDYYHLTREPFHITPDPVFLFLSESHKQALATIMYGIKKKKGFVAITGPVGVGKTMIVRSCLDDLDSQFLKLIYIFNSNVTFNDLVETICQEQDIRIVPGNISQTIRNLHLFLIDEYKAGGTVVIIVDEAQKMPVETLENLRMLSNLETAEDKLIQIVLVGQPELDELLGRYELRQLKQRIALRAEISAFTPQESMDYIDHRLGLTGGKADFIFTGPALRKIVKEAKGIPRIINILCDNTLITACGYGLLMVTPEVVKEVVTDFNGKEWYRRPKWQLAASALFLCLIALFFLVFRNGHVGSTAAQKPISAPVQVASAPSANPAGTDVIAPQANPEIAKNEAITKQASLPAAPERVAAAETAPEQKKTITKRTVEPGDSLSSLTQEVYGRSGREVQKFVKENNPQIKDLDNLRAGSVVNFPELPKNMSLRGKTQGTPAAQKPTGRPIQEASAASVSPASTAGITPPTKRADTRAGTEKEQTKMATKRTVERGDSLSSLTEQVYGRSAAEVLNFVKESNPQIKDVNNLRAGSVVNFPELPKNLSLRGRTNE